MATRPEDVGYLEGVTARYANLGASCSIQQCTKEKRVLTNAFCGEFLCQKLEKCYAKDEYGDESRAHILKQERIELGKWLKEKMKRSQHTRDDA